MQRRITEPNILKIPKYPNDKMIKNSPRIIEP